MENRFDRFGVTLEANPFRSLPRDARRAPDIGIWQALVDLPALCRSRLLREAAFLLTSFPIGLVAFVVAVTGGTTGLALSWLLIGLPILVWTIVLMLRIADIDRARINTMLGERLSYPDYGVAEDANVIRHLGQIARSPRVWRDVAYALVLFPIGVVELTLVLLPLEFLFSGLGYFAVGSVFSMDAFGIEITSWAGALLSMVVGVISIVPVAIAIGIVSRAHLRFARTMLHESLQR